MSTSNYVLIVLTPKGRRETVKVTPNTSILQVLEDVCRKQQLNSNEWDLKHYNRIVELANSVRFSGLANNATLEMVQSQKPRIENVVKLGLQLESGKRLMHQFLPYQTLWDVLLHWESQGEAIFPKYSEAEELISTQPVCIYMRQEVVGKDQLQEITLRSLGLTHGSAIIRFIHRSESQLRHQANVSAPLSRQVITQDEDWHVPSLATHSSKPSPSVHPLEKEITKTEQVPMNVDQPEPQSEASTSKTPALTKSVNPHGSAIVQKQKPPSPVPIEEDNLNVDLTINSIGAGTKNHKKVAVDGQLHILGNHDAILYYADDVSRPSLSSDSIPDSFYDITMADVTTMWRDLQEKRKIIDNAPLQTASARSLEHDSAILRNLREHPVTIVRIRFSDRYVLQGKFRTVDTIAALENFAKQYLNNPDVSFYLFTTPPKKILSSTSRLVEENLVGSAVIYFGCEVQAGEFLKPDLYELVSCPDAVQSYIQTNMEEGNPKPPIDSTTLSMSDSDQQPSTSHGQSYHNQEGQPSTSEAGTATTSRPRGSLNPGSSRLTEGKVPKWYKTGK